MSVLSDAHFHDEEAAYAWVEKRVWPKGPVCPHCGGFDRISKMEGKSTRIGTYKCYQCRKPFTVKVGTIFESSHVALRLWLQAIFLIASSKKGISANQIHRTLGVTLKTAWFMGHRIREAMKDGSITPLGGKGKHVEADETYFGDKHNVVTRTRRGKSGHASKRSVLALVERGGNTRTFHIESADVLTVTNILNKHLDPESTLHTDESKLYGRVKVRERHTVTHSRLEYARKEDGFTAHTNTVEGYFSVFKRGMKGTYQHCAEKHLKRYLAEFDFRHNNRVALGVNDEDRSARIVNGITGKRLTYRTTSLAE